MTFGDQVEEFLKSLNGERARKNYASALEGFRRWYVGSYGVEPDASMLTDESDSQVVK